MSYIHNGREPVFLRNDPIDPDGIDWFFFCYENWLRDNETITTHTASISGGTIVTNSTSIGNMTDTDGTIKTNCYGVKISAASGATQVTLTHRVTTTVAAAVDIGRTTIDKTIIIPVRTL